MFYDFEGSPEAITLGFVTHASNVNETGLGGFEELFEMLSAGGVVLQGLTAASETYGHVAGDPSTAAPEHRCGPDEAL